VRWETVLSRWEEQAPAGGGGRRGAFREQEKAGHGRQEEEEGERDGEKGDSDREGGRYKRTLPSAQATASLWPEEEKAMHTALSPFALDSSH
jgi:hypothetical protein